MVVVADGKLTFSREQVISSTQASKNFGECRRRARREPLFVTDRNASIETVIVDYDEFEAAERLADADAHPRDALITFEEMLGEDGYRSFLEIDPDDMPDEELFA